MIEKVEISVLVNNTVMESKLLAEHGLSLLLSAMVNGEEKKVLLDTGQSPQVLMHNMAVMGISLDDLSALIISHGHYDHTGGLVALLRSLGRTVRVVAHPAAWGRRKKSKPHIKEIGSGLTPEAIAQAGGEWVDGSDPVFLDEYLLTTGAIPRHEPLEISTSFLREENGALVPDQIRDDLGLVVDLGDRGLLIATGCCHAGIINTIQHAMQITHNPRVHTVIGGLHLIGASKERLQRTAGFLKQIRPQGIVALHCSGLLETCFLRQQLGNRVIFGAVGTKVSF